MDLSCGCYRLQSLTAIDTLLILENRFTKNSSVTRKIFIAAYCIASLVACSNSKIFNLPVFSNTTQRTGGTGFYKTVAACKWAARDSLAVQQILAGNIPFFLKKFVAVTSTMQDSMGISHRAVFFVSPDYLSVGTDEDWARIPLTPMAAQKIADSFHCFLPTRKMVDLIYQQATVKLEPVPMYAFRDSSGAPKRSRLRAPARRVRRPARVLTPEGLGAGEQHPADRPRALYALRRLRARVR